MRFLVSSVIAAAFAYGIVHFEYSGLPDFQQAVLFWGIYFGILGTYLLDDIRTAIVK